MRTYLAEYFLLSLDLTQKNNKKKTKNKYIQGGMCFRQGMAQRKRMVGQNAVLDSLPPNLESRWWILIFNYCLQIQIGIYPLRWWNLPKVAKIKQICFGPYFILKFRKIFLVNAGWAEMQQHLFSLRHTFPSSRWMNFCHVRICAMSA